MNRGMTKAERLREMERLYVQHQGGLTDDELAERFGVTRSTIFRDRRELECEIPFKKVAPGRWAIDRTKYLSSIRVNLTEALVLYLAARRTSRHTRTHQAHVVSALEKLAAALKQPMTEHLVKTAASIAEQDPQPERSTIMETIVQGWAEHVKVRITHKALWSKRAMTYTISPYLIEPSLWSDGTYVIGHSDVHNGLATFKIERIERAVLTTERFTPPDDFDEQELLKFAWGIWYSDEDPVTVRLKFTGRKAVTRLKENIWHPMQEPLVDTDDGGCIWEAQVAELQEMVPWIRGWGADVEVLEPEELREALVRETKRLALLYQVGNVEPLPLYRRLWAKTDQLYGTDGTHSLIFHMLDVSQVTLALWDHALPEATRRYFGKALGAEPETARCWLGFVAALHDLGKACPAFQGRHAPSKHTLSAELSFPDTGNVKTPHGWVSTLALLDLLSRQLGIARPVARQIAYAVGGHHGAFPNTRALDELGPARRGGEDWETVRLDLFEALVKLFNVHDLPVWSSDTVDDPVFWTLLAGLISFADWIGSIEKYFFRLDAPDLPTYAERAYRQAVSVLEKLGWTGYTPPTGSPDFDLLFGFSPRPLQEASVALAARLPSPALVIVEAPTGEGKTEAALYLADAWLHRTQQRGIYVAMPTQATSNQMLSRVRCYLEKRYTDQQANLLLLHGNAVWSEELDELRLAAVDEESESTVVAHSWFLQNKKRGLLAPFAVGTIDQALLSVLQTKHFFVRLFGLSHKTVIFDEVHAYDTYMGTLLQHLLRWLAAMDTTVILLSATLPAQTRRELIEAYTGRDLDLSVPYPAITWATPDAEGGLPLETSATSARTLNLEWIEGQPAKLVTALREALHDGGCVAVICNTVSRAQEVYDLLSGESLVPEDDLILFHARFPFAWRQEIEAQVLSRLGPDTADRPQRAIVVATQVIEQSLDLDFDLMISQMAPVDLLLQRAGRLHRHARDERPGPLSEPRFWVILPEIQDVLPRWGSDGKIYAPYVLLRSYLALRGREILTVPDDVPDLIAAVYDDPEKLPPVADPTLAQALEKEYAKMLDKIDKQEYQAQNNLIAWPDDEDVFSTRNKQLDEDNPELHETWRALTRLTRPSVTLVCLHRQPDGGLVVEPESGVPIDLDQEPNRETTTLLAQHAVTVSDYRVVKYFLAQDPPEGWREHALLRYYRAAIFDHGRCECTDTLLALDRRRGLIIEKKEDV